MTATGPAVLVMFDNCEMYTGCALPVIGEFISPRELIETFCRVTGRKAVYRSAVTREALLHHFPSFIEEDGMVDEITRMVEHAVTYCYFTKNRNLIWSRKINSQSLAWENFLINTDWQGDALTF